MSLRLSLSRGAPTCRWTPFALQNRVSDGVTPWAVSEDMIPNTALFNHAVLEHDGGRGKVRRGSGALDSVETEVSEPELEQQAHRLGTVASPPVLWIQGEADLASAVGLKC